VTLATWQAAMAEPEPMETAEDPSDAAVEPPPELAARADETKQRANAAFAAQKFAEAIDLYTEAIELVPSAPLYSNRAFAHIKMESMGSAIQDADSAIKLDKRFTKAYYRKGTALAGLSKNKQAKKQFANVCKLQPKNKPAAAMVKSLEKLIKAEAFAKAIQSDESSFDSLDVDTIEVEEGYTGPHLTLPLTIEQVNAMTDAFKDGKKLHRKYAIQLLVAAREVLSALPPMVELDIPTGGHFTVCGDTHGQFFDLMNIFAINGRPADDNPYLFNGDFVDRGSWSVEVILTLLAYKVLTPMGLHLNRGNHETLNMNRVYGFTGEVKAKLTEKCFPLFTELFCALPLCHVLGGKVLCLHGGLFSQDGVKLDDLRKIDRFREPPEEGCALEEGDIS
jgi:serine/threonine-protein phosphatase 5